MLAVSGKEIQLMITSRKNPKRPERRTVLIMPPGVKGWPYLFLSIIKIEKEHGGGVGNESGMASLTNVTLSGNSATMGASNGDACASFDQRALFLSLPAAAPIPMPIPTPTVTASTAIRVAD
jgi:hypothetical protein